MPDGRGLPPGAAPLPKARRSTPRSARRATARAAKARRSRRLVATDAGKNFDFATNAKLPRAVGNYWPYATTLYDYTYRAMPFMQPGTLTRE